MGQIETIIIIVLAIHCSIESYLRHHSVAEAESAELNEERAIEAAKRRQEGALSIREIEQ